MNRIFSLRRALCAAAGAGWVAIAAAGAPPTAQHTARSPYAGEESRAIKSLSADDIAELRRGGGWGLAKTAELNGMPGPAHLLELKDAILLDPEQVETIGEIFAEMRARAIAEGERLIAREQALEDAFRERTITRDSLRRLLSAIAESRSELRYLHLAAHLETLPLLSEAQVARYQALRGYGAGTCENPPAGHDPAMWRRHHGCD